jgi:hypothetical protein
MTRRILPVVLFCLSISGAYAKPNFSGTWKLNTETSDFGPMPKPEKGTMTIDHSEPNVQFSNDATGPRGQQVTKFKYVTDGSEVSNTNGPVEMKSKAKWDGDALVVETTGNLQGNDLTLSDKWSLSGDGKTFKMNRHIKVPQGEFDQVYVYEKQ